jgi:hypothetical protein
VVFQRHKQKQSIQGLHTRNSDIHPISCTIPTNNDNTVPKFYPAVCE